MTERTPARGGPTNPLIAMTGFSDPRIVLGHIVTLLVVLTALWLGAPASPTIVGGLFAIAVLHFTRAFLIVGPSGAGARVPAADQPGAPSARTVIVWVFMLAVLPLWIGLLWLAGPVRLGPPPVAFGSAVLERVTARDFETLDWCIAKNGRDLPILRSIPSEATDTRRYTDNFETMIIEVSAHPTGSVVRLYQTGDAALPEQYIGGVTRCAPAQ